MKQSFAKSAQPLKQQKEKMAKRMTKRELDRRNDILRKKEFKAEREAVKRGEPRYKVE